MNILFVIILAFLGIIARIFGGSKKLISHYINLGYIISLTLIWKMTLSIQYYSFILFTMCFFYIFEIILKKISSKRVKYNFESRLFLPLLILNITSYLFMFINFINRFGLLNPLKYGFIYENNLYMPGLTLIYRSIIPLFIYSVYKILHSTSSKKVYYFTVIYSFVTLFIKYNKTDIAILLLIVIIFVYDKYFTRSIAFKHKAKALIIIGFMSVTFLFYFISFYTKIFQDDIVINNQIILYTSEGQLFLDYNLQNDIWARFEYLNFFNVFSGYIKPDRIFLNSISTNVYGLFGDIFNDFYYYGIIIGPFIINILFYILNKLTKNNIIGFVFLAAYFTLAFFNPYVLLIEFWVQAFFLVLLSRTAKYIIE